MTRPLIIIGAGGHAKVLVEALLLGSAPIVGLLEKEPERKGATVLGVPVIGDDGLLLDYPPESVLLVNGIGSVADATARKRVFETLKRRGYRFASVVHPSAVVASDASLAEGVQIMAGAIVQPGCSIGANSVINTRASVDHDCRVGEHVHVAPGATMSGNVCVGPGGHIGSGATVIQGMKIGAGSVVGAGAVVVSDVPSNVTVMGVPARVK